MLKFKKNTDYNFHHVQEQLVQLQYKRVDLVVDRGDFAVRGGIIDIFPANQTTPIRLEFFDTLLESIRSFNVADQRSFSDLTETSIASVAEYPHILVRTTDFLEREDCLLPDFVAGEYVVHENYGVAVFKGLVHLQEHGVEGEYYELQFAGSEVVYVPIDQSRLIHAYTAGDLKPTLSSLSAKTWEGTKQKVKKAAKNIAFDLFNLYRQRTLAKGYAFGDDSELQIQMEQRFPYKETDDQLTAIQDVKKDMQHEQPMDRLICGDVGYGKTEIALRAAFKAAAEGKQVAVLAPTTILVSQHYHNFSKRYEGFGLTCAMLSRFHTPAQNRAIISGLKKGTIDVVIGTHRLLQQDIGFKDLGLLIVDEEQRFGVEHKEFMKKMFVNVDILSLSATPIPRTLYMTMSGVRDISVLSTAPEKRQPIKTICTEFSESTVRQAITDELRRNGQIYFLNNDIKALPVLQRKIHMLVPEARICIAHGKMPKHELEEVIIKFIDQKYDILLCTTIIENGIDIPNVNTIIVNNADCFGLAQLHQIRGRVGRSSVKGYAYLLYHPDKILSTDAQKRLHTLKEFTALGAGYRIALKDLEIRGAGNILGSQQSGYVQSIGFTLYCKLLEESVRELKGEKIEKEEVFTLPSREENYIPSDYMAEEELRISFYRRILEVTSLPELSAISNELKDRFGEIPKATQNLINNVTYQLNRKAGKVKKVHYHPKFKKPSS
jgi:transcription-repair coupling factor (superfamily II helicase)